ncbi:MAG: ECF-type riboflavin transporter substrate-binding protein [Kineothrix sp.]|jgi:energy-coupling factor transport system substrate-specific component|nr:hypothetical protein C807_02496 [Lachnospiraceae bacterium 28-4]MCX4344304.1 ECF-type riboflavin transporter substrate-binding protein [Kineothrix sp.]
MKKLSVKSVVAIGIGAALFFVLGKISIPTPVPNTYISLQYAVQAVFAMLFGPIAGLLIGLVGHTLIDATNYGPWWSWIIASGMAGLIIGIITMKLDMSEGLDGKKLIRFNVAQVIAHLVSWGFIAPCLDILIYAEPLEKLFMQGLVAGISNMLTTGVVGTLLLIAYSKTLVKKGSLNKE